MSQELNEFERALLAMAPASPRLDRDALMYAAGRGSRRRRWLWPGAACGLALLAAGLGLRLATREPQIVERIVVVHDEPSKSAASDTDSAMERERASNDVKDSAGDGYLEMEREILRRGDMPLPSPTGTAQGAGPPSLDRELDLPPERLRALHLSPSS